jgi:hypothetical protein
MKNELALFGIAAMGGLAFMTGTASAKPNSSIGQVRYVCIPWQQCGKSPNHYGGGCRFYVRPQRYWDWHKGYPGNEGDMSPATQASAEGGR